MNRNSNRIGSPVINIVNIESIADSSKDLLRELQNKLPDCEFRLLTVQEVELFKVPNNSIFLVINIDEKESRVQKLVTRLDNDLRRYVTYPVPIGSGYQATNFSQLLRFISQMIMQNIGSMSQISVNTIIKTQKPNVLLHVIIAKSQDEEFRYCVKSVYKKYRNNPYVDFFQSRTLQKIHTGLFPRVLFIINADDIQTYRSGYNIFFSKKTPLGQIVTLVFVKSSLIPYGFNYDGIINSKQKLQHVLLSMTEKMQININNKTTLSRSKSMTQQTVSQTITNKYQTPILVLDSVDQKYRQFYSKIQSQYLRVNHLNHSYDSQTTFIMPSSARNFINHMLGNPNINIILISEQTTPSSNLNYQPGVKLITKDINELNSYLRKQNPKDKRASQIPNLNNQNYEYIVTKPYQKQNMLPPTNDQQKSRNVSYNTRSPSSSNNDLVNANLSKITENNLEYTLTEGAGTNRSLGSGPLSQPKISTNQLILKQTQDHISKIYDDYFDKQQQKPPLPVSKPQSKKSSVSINQNQYLNYQEQLNKSKSSIKVESKNSIKQKPNYQINQYEQPRQYVQSIQNVQTTFNRNSLKENLPQRQYQNTFVSPTKQVKPKYNTIFEQRYESPKINENTFYRSSRTSFASKPSFVDHSQFSDGRRSRRISQARQNQYFQSEASTPRDRSSITSPQRSMRPQSPKVAGKLSVIQTLGQTRSKTLSQMLEKQNRVMKQQSQMQQYQVDFGQQNMLQIIFKTSSEFIEHFSKYFQVYPCSIYRYQDLTQLPNILPILNKSLLTVLIMDVNQIVQNVRMFKNFNQFHYIISCKQQKIPRLKHKFPNTVFMKQYTHTKSFKQLLSYIRYLKFSDQQLKISDKQLIPHISAIQSSRIYIPNWTQIQKFIDRQLSGYQIIHYSTEKNLLDVLQSNQLINSNNIKNVIILKNGSQRLVEYLITSVFNVKKILIFEDERDVDNMKSELMRMAH